MISIQFSSLLQFSIYLCPGDFLAGPSWLFVVCGLLCSLVATLAFLWVPCVWGYFYLDHLIVVNWFFISQFSETTWKVGCGIDLSRNLFIHTNHIFLFNLVSIMYRFEIGLFIKTSLQLLGSSNTSLSPSLDSRHWPCGLTMFPSELCRLCFITFRLQEVSLDDTWSLIFYCNLFNSEVFI